MKFIMYKIKRDKIYLITLLHYFFVNTKMILFSIDKMLEPKELLEYCKQNILNTTKMNSNIVTHKRKNIEQRKKPKINVEIIIIIISTV